MLGMKQYHYQIIQYIPDRVTGEFVNVGVVLYCPEETFLDCLVINKYSRLSCFFGEINGDYIIKQLKSFQAALRRDSRSIQGLFANSENRLEGITRSLWSPDDSALRLTDVKKGVDPNPKGALDYLYERLIIKYAHEGQTNAPNDKLVWSRYYKKWFDKYGISEYLKEYEVKTAMDKIHFEKAWQNGVWNCFQGLSLDLKRHESAKNKVYKWAGILEELEASKEHLHIYFLMVSNKKNADVEEFVSRIVERHAKKNLQITLVKQAEAESFALTMKQRIEESEGKKIK